MSLVTLLPIAEQQFAAYLSANLSTSYQKQTPDGLVTGQYTVTPAYTIAPYELPLVVVKAGKFAELEPQTDVYEGTLAITLITQVDDVADPVGVHDGVMGQIYDLMRDIAGVQAAVNASNFHLWGIYVTSYDIEITNNENKRAIISQLELRINCQTLQAS